MRQARTRFTPERALAAAAALILVIGTQMPVTSYLSPKGGVGYALGVFGGVLLLVPALSPFSKRLLSCRSLVVGGIFESCQRMGCRVIT